ncbi:IS66 family insertion sequence element accessory protein TnpB [Salmonella enterica subsp. enterica]|nr:IS66 family insertion sequence hypothetical protein [Salmonella enterica]EBS2904724.1 IS66 family insertion sequence hypothetical protein [Salmonella enterica subsp. enterica serovar Flottbek]EDP8831433.1 IS66 family insertion sequence element accessory protein TnpB [Salmonella enterica subsp. enterica]EEE4101148.1 IS66 family insertion sequence element accessory protein TnpB [Salmonella enterica subsp. enterica serovar Enteritidis]EGY8942368.1 IS66 family insertion sequence element accessor
MLTPENAFLAVKLVDMRRGIDALTQYIQDKLKSSWHDGIAFVFTNKACSCIKVLRWDKYGAWLCNSDVHLPGERRPVRNGGSYQGQRLMIMDVLMPPNAKLLLCRNSQSILRASPIM